MPGRRACGTPPSLGPALAQTQPAAALAGPSGRKSPWRQRAALRYRQGDFWGYYPGIPRNQLRIRPYWPKLSSSNTGDRMKTLKRMVAW